MSCFSALLVLFLYVHRTSRKTSYISCQKKAGVWTTIYSKVTFYLPFYYLLGKTHIRIHGISQSPRYFFALPRDKKSPPTITLGHRESYLELANINMNSISWIYVINYPPTVTYSDLLSSGVLSNSATVFIWDIAWDPFFYTGNALWPLPANKTKIWSSWYASASCTSSKLRMEADRHRHGWPSSLLRQRQLIHHSSHWLLD